MAKHRRCSSCDQYEPKRCPHCKAKALPSRIRRPNSAHGREYTYGSSFMWKRFKQSLECRVLVLEKMCG